MLNQSLPSCEAETIIQNIIQDLSFNVEPSIRKGSSAHGAPVGHTFDEELSASLLQYWRPNKSTSDLVFSS